MHAHHMPIKYGFDCNKPPPLPALGQGGKFSRSFDDRLWLFHRRWEPSGDVKATLIIVHGTVDHSGVYDELAKALSEAGVAVFAMDMRGWGLSDGESIYFNDVDTFVSDVDAFYNEIHSIPKYSAVESRYLLGKSLGGIVTAFTVAKYPNHFNGLLGLSGAYEINQDPGFIVTTVLKILNFFSPKHPLRQLFDPKLIVSDAYELQKWKDDPLCSKDKGRVGYIVELLRCCKKLSKSLVHTIDVPMLMMVGTADQVVTLSGHQLMVEKSCNEDTTLKTYVGGYHNLLAEPDLKKQVIHDIQEWILGHVAKK